MSRKTEFDENPEWTREDFKKAKPPHELLSPEILSAFPKTKQRGPQKAPKKVPVSIRLSPDVLRHYKAEGAGWQSRIEQTLRKAAGLK